MTDPIIKHIDPHIHQDDEHTNNLKLTILTSNSGWQVLHSRLYNFFALCYFVHLRRKLLHVKSSNMYLKHCPESSSQRLPQYTNGLLNLESNTLRNIVKQAIVVGNFIIIFMQAKYLVIIDGSINLEDTVVDTHS